MNRIYEKYNKPIYFKKSKFVKVNDRLDPYSREFWYYKHKGQTFEVIGMKWDNYITHKRYHVPCGEYGLIDNQYILRFDCQEIKMKNN